jgi:hypothetical protein
VAVLGVLLLSSVMCISQYSEEQVSGDASIASWYTVAGTDYKGEYDGSSHTISLADPVINDDTYTDVTFTKYYSTDETDYSTNEIECTDVADSATVYWKVCNSETDEIVTGHNTVTITAKQTVIAGTTVSSKIYDGTTAAAVTVGTLDGGLSSDSSTVSVSGVGTFASENAGSGISATVVYSLSGDSAGNYIAPVNGTFTSSISTRAVVMTSATAGKTYDGSALTANEVTESGDGFIEGDGATYNVTGTIWMAGTADNTFTHALNSGTDGSNYSISTVTGTPTVAKYCGIVIVANSSSKMYDGTALTCANYVLGTDYLISGSVVSGDDLDVTLTGEQLNVGTTSIKATCTITRDNVDVTSCYQLGVGDQLGSLSVTTRSVTLRSGSSYCAYNGAAHTNDGLGVYGDGFVSGESFSDSGMVVTATYTDSTTAVVTDYTYSPTGSLTTSDDTVTVSYTHGGATVTADVTIKVNDPTYTLTLSASPSDGGSVTGAGTYVSGTSVTVSATPAEGYEFVSWSDGGDQTHSVTVTEGMTLSAVFAKQTFEISVPSSVDNGSVSVSVNPV